VYRDPLLLLLAAIVGGLILWKHRGNMVRMVKGTESKFTLHKKASADAAAETAGETSAAPAAEASKEGEASLEAAQTALEEPSDEAEQEEDKA
jgi:glycerol-3-phosphate acyltransferase PlsY